jgi:HSP20 family protein
MIVRRRTLPMIVFAEHSAPWAPSVDVCRTPSGWVLKLDLAGVRPNDVTIAVRGRYVSVSGVRRDSLVEERPSYYSMEISYNQFERTIEMPCDLGNARVTLETRDGILLVRMITEGE